MTIKLKFFFIFCSLLGLMMLCNKITLACTDIALLAKDGTAIIGRSMEFALNFNSNVVAKPQATVFKTTTPNGKPGLSWKSIYGYLAIDGLNAGIVIDGMNEKGLSFEYLYFPGYTQYQSVPMTHENQSLPYYLLGDWILGNFKSVPEVISALKKIYVFEQLIPGVAPPIVFQVHAAIHDATGAGIVIEFINGQMKIYKNINIMTNSPSYPWQLDNLSNYLNLTPYNPKPITIGGITYTANGQGSGMLGLPGDFSSPSRFVKMAAYLKTVFPADNTQNAVNLAEHLLNTVDIPLGVVRAKENNGPDAEDITQWIVIKDLTNKVLYYRTYNNLALHAIHLKEIDFSPNAMRLKMPLADKPVIINVTEHFKRSAH